MKKSKHFTNVFTDILKVFIFTNFNCDLAKKMKILLQQRFYPGTTTSRALISLLLMILDPFQIHPAAGTTRLELFAACASSTSLTEAPPG